ncbi:MAG: endolytic transglycosylase MltG [Deltaproteobacteria bacterium]|nr:endolytic transglycosylase MltG [Deltaproteobacteria bacterium]
MRKIAIALAVLLVLVVAAAGGGWWWFNKEVSSASDPGSTELIELAVPKGATLQKIGGLLKEQGLIRSPLVFRIYVKLNPGHDPKAGRHHVTRAMALPALLAALDAPPLPEDVPLTIVEGWRLSDIDEALAAQGVITAGQYLAAAKNPARFQAPFTLSSSDLEGYVYPETYAVPKGPLDVDRLIQRQLEAFSERFAKPYADEIAKSGRTLHELVVMASLLEREEPKPEIRPKVAGVLYKRLEKKTPLGVDATSRFTLADWNDRVAFLKKLRDPDDPYNTRLRVGLPPGPIGAPSLPSLVAALRPEPSPYFYYLHDSEKNIHFAADAAGHEANRKKYNVY